MNDELSDTDLPELQDAILSEAKLDELFADLAACADVQSVRMKSGARLGAEDATVTLDEARTLLKAGNARGAQIRYLYQQRMYTDTLIRTDEGFRLIRM